MVILKEWMRYRLMCKDEPLVSEEGDVGGEEILEGQLRTMRGMWKRWHDEKTKMWVEVAGWRKWKCDLTNEIWDVI